MNGRRLCFYNLLGISCPFQQLFNNDCLQVKCLASLLLVCLEVLPIILAGSREGNCLQEKGYISNVQIWPVDVFHSCSLHSALTRIYLGLSFTVLWDEQQRYRWLLMCLFIPRIILIRRPIRPIGLVSLKGDPHDLGSPQKVWVSQCQHPFRTLEVALGLWYMRRSIREGAVPIEIGNVLSNSVGKRWMTSIYRGVLKWKYPDSWMV